MRMAWIPSEHDERLKRLWAAGETTREIARLMGFAKRTIDYRARMLGLPDKRPGRPSKAARNAEIRMRFNDGISREALSIEYGLTPETIANIATKGNRGKKVKG